MTHFADSEYLEPSAGFDDVIHRHGDATSGFGAAASGFGGGSGFGASADAAFLESKMKSLPANFHDADASTKITPDGKVHKNKYEVHKEQGKNFKSYSYSTSNSVTW